MKRVIAAILLLLLVAAPVASIEPAAESVRAISVPLPDADGYGELRNICTASAIGDGTKWLSAAHCVSRPELRYYISGEQVQVVSRDDMNDLIILSTRRVRVPPLKVAKNGPQVGQSTIILGYPFGLEDVVQSVGLVMGFALREDPDGHLRELLFIQAVVAPGNSGSPVLNMKGEIVSVVQIGFSQSFGPVLAAVNYETLRDFVAKAIPPK